MKESLLAIGKQFLTIGIYGVGTIVYAILTDTAVPFLPWIFVFIALQIFISLPLINTPKDYAEADSPVYFTPLYNLDYQESAEDDIGILYIVLPINTIERMQNIRKRIGL